MTADEEFRLDRLVDRIMNGAFDGVECVLCKVHDALLDDYQAADRLGDDERLALMAELFERFGSHDR